MSRLSDVDNEAMRSLVKGARRDLISNVEFNALVDQVQTRVDRLLPKTGITRARRRRRAAAYIHISNHFAQLAQDELEPLLIED